MDLTSVVSALRLTQQIVVALFACILLEVCMLGIRFGAFISLLSRPNKVSTAGLITGNGNTRFNIIFERVLMVCYLLWISAASTASEKSLHLFWMHVVVDCCGLLLTFVQSGYLYHLTVCARFLKLFLFDSQQRSTDGMNSGMGQGL